MLDVEQSEPLVEGFLDAPPSDSPSTVFGLVERVALDPRADVEKLERVMAMYERLKAKEAELAYNSAKGRILRKLARIKIVKNRCALHETEKRGGLQRPPPSSTPRWRRSTSTYARSWWRRIWISPIPTNRGRMAGS